MKAILYNLHGNLSRERWEFTFVCDWVNQDRIYLDCYVYETRESTRHRKWKTQNRWVRLDKRLNTIDLPPLGTDIETRARQFFIEQIKQLPISF